MIGNLSRREKTLLLILFLVVVIGGYYLYIFTPAQEEIARLEEEFFRAEDELFRDQLRVQRYPELKEELAELEWKIESLHASLPTEMRVSDFLDDLEQIAKRLQIQFGVFRPQEASFPSDFYGTKNYRLNIRGPYDRVILFLTALEEFQQPLEVQYIQMVGTRDNGWVEVETVVKSFFLL